MRIGKIVETMLQGLLVLAFVGGLLWVVPALWVWTWNDVMPLVGVHSKLTWLLAFKLLLLVGLIRYAVLGDVKKAWEKGKELGRG